MDSYVVDQRVETMMEFTVENGKVGWKGSENNRARGKLSFSPPFLRACVQFLRENGGQINALLRIEEHHSCVGKGVRFRVRNTWFLSQTFDVTSVNQDRR